MPGAPDPLYVRARKALFDAAEALAAHLDAIVLVGAQAIYVHTGDADVADPAYGFAAEYTTDADLTIDPRDLTGSPLVADLLEERGFSLGADPGAWVSPDGIAVDLMVPEPLAGPGRRGARLGSARQSSSTASKGFGGSPRRSGAGRTCVARPGR